MKMLQTIDMQCLVDLIHVSSKNTYVILLCHKKKTRYVILQINISFYTDV